jgi:hypothetical protein
VIPAHLVFLPLPLPNSSNSIWRKFTAVVQNAAPGGAPRGVARHGTAQYGAPIPAPPSLLLSWRNMRSILLWPILFCIFGMCSPRRKSAATVRTVYRRLSPQFHFSLSPAALDMYLYDWELTCSRDKKLSMYLFTFLYREHLSQRVWKALVQKRTFLFPILLKETVCRMCNAKRFLYST